MRRILVLGVILLLSLLAQSKSSESQGPITLCDVIKAGDGFDGRKIEVKANYRYGLELDELFCGECREAHRRISVAFSEEFDWKPMRKAHRDAGVVSAKFIGVLTAKENKSNNYRYTFTVHAVKDVVVIEKGLVGKKASYPPCCKK